MHEITAEWLAEVGFCSGSMLGVLERKLGDPRRKMSQPAFIQIEITQGRVVAMLYIGKGYRAIDVKNRGDVLRVTEVFEGPSL